jgi:hypothetical protein
MVTHGNIIHNYLDWSDRTLLGIVILEIKVLNMRGYDLYSVVADS